MPAKICILTSVHRPFDTRIFHKEAKSLVKAGYDVTLVAQHDKDEIVDGIRIVSLPKPRNRIERMTKTVLKLFGLAIKEKADIYHSHDPELIPVGLLLKLFGKTVIYDVHEDVPEQILSKEYIPKSFKKVISTFLRIFENFFSKAFDFTITSTNAIRHKFLKYTPNVSDVKNYISISYIRHNNLSQKDSIDNTLEMIFVGRIYKERGIIEGIKAICLLPDLPIKFVLYGPISGSFLLKLKNLDSLERVEYRGILPYSEVINKLSESNIGFICDCPLKRHMEGLPVKLFEYMAAGLPVIASNFPLWKQIVEKHNCGICVDPINPEEIAKSIKYLYENPGVREKMGENGGRAILEEYSWEKEEKKLLKIYEKLRGNK